MARLLDPQPGETVYDPCCGSAASSSSATSACWRPTASERNGRLKLPSTSPRSGFTARKSTPSTFAMARMNAFIHDMEAEIALGDTMHRPAFTRGRAAPAFDIVTANPMWNQKFDAATYENDPYERFTGASLPSSSADWGWVQHMLAR